MGPLRILILAVLLYIGYRLIMKNFRKSVDQNEDTAESGEPGSITDVLVEDPVCHKLVPKQQARELENEGETHYFCSQECYDKFVAQQGEEQ